MTSTASPADIRDDEILAAFLDPLYREHTNTYFMSGFCGHAFPSFKALAGRLAAMRSRGLLASVRRPYRSEGHDAVYWTITEAGRKAVAP